MPSPPSSHTLLALLSLAALLACEDTRYQSAFASDDAGLPDTQEPDPDLPPEPEPEPAPEAEPTPPIAGPCVVTFTDAQGAFDCPIDARTALGCDEMARCMCRFALDRAAPNPDPPFDLENCVFSLVVPRGAITLADYCPLSGLTDETVSLPALIEEIVDPVGVFNQPLPEIAFSEACHEIAAYTLWGETPAWNLSLAIEGVDALPDVLQTRIEDYPIEPPLLTIADIRTYRPTEARAKLTANGQAALRQRLADPNLDPQVLIGRHFLVHTDLVPLMVGRLWSRAISASVDGALLYLEDIAEADHAELRFQQILPIIGPASPDDFRAQIMLSHLAGGSRLIGARCLSTCSCPAQSPCRRDLCLPDDGRCVDDADCCLGTCTINGVCEDQP